MMRISGTTIVPTVSMWTMGFREILPIILPVGSPRRSAIQARADSRTQIANNSTITWKKTSTGLIA